MIKNQSLYQIRKIVERIHQGIPSSNPEVLERKVKVYDCSIPKEVCGLNVVCHDCDVYVFAQGKKKGE